MSWLEVLRINSNINTPLDVLVKSGSIPIVKSVQKADVNLSYNVGTVNVTISPVNMNKSICLLNGSSFADIGTGRTSLAKLTTSTNVCVMAKTVNAANTGVTVSFTVIEFY